MPPALSFPGFGAAVPSHHACQMMLHAGDSRGEGGKWSMGGKGRVAVLAVDRANC